MARLKRLLREPLVHFLAIGALLVVGDRVLNPTAEPDLESSRIEITEDDLVQMSVRWLAQGRPALTADQLQNLIELRVREEILYREALALGLDKGDAIVRRRLVQKMEFLAEDISGLTEPSPQELREWFADNAQRFALEPRVSFRHLYFSFDRRGEGAGEAAAGALRELAAKPSDWPETAVLTDPFMFQDHYGDRSFGEIAKLFGPGFARALFQMEPGAWRGPIESGYGWHLIFVDTVTPSRLPAFEEIEQEVKREWMGERRAEARGKVHESMRARYHVVLPELPVEQSAGVKASAPTVNR